MTNNFLTLLFFLIQPFFIISSLAQDYIYPNKLISDKGLIEYRRYTLEEAKAYENGNSLNQWAITDWGLERRIANQECIYCADVQNNSDSLFCTYATIFGGGGDPYAHVYFIASTDNGATWGRNIELGDTSININIYFPDVVCQGSDVIVGYRAQWPSRGEDLFFRKSSNGGETWGSLQRVFPYWLNNGRNYASLTNSGRTLYFAYLMADPDSLRVVRSSNWGTSWEGVGANVAYLQSTPQTMKIAASGNFVHLVWVNENIPVSVHYSGSTDQGLTWSPEIDISNDSSGAQLPYLAVQDSQIVISWMGYKYSPFMFTGDYFYRQSSDNGASWDTAKVLTDIHKVADTDISLRDSIIIVAWMDSRFEPLGNDEIMTRISLDHGENWEEERRLSFGANTSYRPGSAIGENLIHVLWGDIRPDSQGLYYCSNNLLTGVNSDDDPISNDIYLSTYPNPFNSSITIKYSNKEANKYEINIYNIVGEKIKTIKIDRKEGQVAWDGTNDDDNPVSSGIYFARIKTSSHDITAKLILLK